MSKLSCAISKLIDFDIKHMNLNNTMTSKVTFSDLEEFFSKEIKKIDYGSCQESFPCKHQKIKVTYKDNSVKYFSCDGHSMNDLCKKLNKELPDHFSYMKNFNLDEFEF